MLVGIIQSFEELTDDSDLREKLRSLYGSIDKVEFVVGFFAEKPAPNRLYGELMYAMVAYDAFTQIYTNPLLSENVYNASTFTKLGLEKINDTNTLQDLANRNLSGSVKAALGVESS
jgi:prostaglandin-endoperoxide synthase 2